jgi:hypothetical protein
MPSPAPTPVASASSEIDLAKNGADEFLDWLEDQQGGVESEVAVEFLNQRKDVADYISSSLTPEQLRKLVEGLEAGLDSGMEMYADRLVISVAAIECISNALRNNLQHPELGKRITEFLEGCFKVALCPTDYASFPETVLEYADQMKPWLDVFSPKKVVGDAIIAMESELDDYAHDAQDYDHKVLKNIFLKLSEYTSREFVSATVYELSQDSSSKEGYDYLVKKKLIDPGVVLEAQPEEAKSTSFQKDPALLTSAQKAIHALVKLPEITTEDLLNFRQHAGKETSVLLALKLGELVLRGELTPVLAICSSTPLLFDPEIACVAITEAVAAAQSRSAESIKQLRLLPDGLIDWSDPRIVEQLAKTERLTPVVAAAPQKQKASKPTSSSKGSGRKFSPMSIEQLKEKIFATQGENDYLDGIDRGGLTTLTARVKKDLAKVNFNNQNVLIEGQSVSTKDILGFRTLPNGLSFLGVQAGGDWEYPVFFIIYHDGSELRGYIPADGNPFNSKTKTAYGNNEEADNANIKERFPELLTSEQKKSLAFAPLSILRSNTAKIIADIEARILPR